MKTDLIFEEVFIEVGRAMDHHPPYHSAHEGYAVIKEELDELWEEVRKKARNRSAKRLREEAIQVAATAIRFALEVDGSV